MMEERVKNLLQMGLNAKDNSGKTPLILSAWLGDLETVKKLLSMDADTSITDELGYGVLHFAADQNNVEVLNLILKTNVDINQVSERGYKQAPLFNPALAGRTAILQKLLEHGANPDIQDKYKMTALQWAAQQDKSESVRTLLAFRANVNTKNNKGVTPLMSAAISGNMDSVRMLVEAGAEINATDKTGFTALMFAAYYDKLEIVKFLLTQGADKNIESKKGETAKSIAEKKSFGIVASILA